MTAEDCLGQDNVPAVAIVPQGSEADVHSLADDLFKFALDNSHNTVITQVTKESASKFRENSFPPSNLSFHLQSVETNFVSWKRTDARVSKEVFKCKILPGAVSRCFSIQSTKSEASQSNRMIIPFSDILGLEVKEDSIVMDVGVLPKMEKRVSSSKTVDESCHTSKGKWKEETVSDQVNCEPPYRICVKKQRFNDPSTIQLNKIFAEISSLKLATENGLRDSYPRTPPCAETNPEEKYPVIKDPTLVRAGQLACLRLFQCLPSQDQTEFVIKMYSSMEERFNSLLRKRIGLTVQPPCQ